MAVVILKNRDCEENVATQQEQILQYALSRRITIDATEIDNFSSQEPLEKRKWLKGFLRSLKPKDTVLAYNLRSFTPRVDELVKIFECMLKRDIELHLCAQNFIVSNRASAFSVLCLLSKQREKEQNPNKMSSIGRPKGRMSRSKFDDNRALIVSMLEKNLNVSRIARDLKMSRSSLKDYIISRGLKEFANAKKNLPPKQHKTDKLITRQNAPLKSDEECALIRQTNKDT